VVVRPILQEKGLPSQERFPLFPLEHPYAVYFLLRGVSPPLGPEAARKVSGEPYGLRRPERRYGNPHHGGALQTIALATTHSPAGRRQTRHHSSLSLAFPPRGHIVLPFS